MMILPCIDNYNRHMGGVDTADQLRYYYDLQLISWRTWWPMLFWAYDAMVVNAFIIFKSMPQTPELEHKQFRLQCAWGLINAWGGAKEQENSMPGDNPTACTCLTLVPQMAAPIRLLLG